MTKACVKRIAATYSGAQIPYERFDVLGSGLQRYLEHGCPTGHFLAAVLSGELYEAVGRADLNSQRELVRIVEFVSTWFPNQAYGTREKYDAWVLAWQEKDE